MCGVLGGIGTNHASSPEALWVESQIRGKHATGYFDPLNGLMTAPGSAENFAVPPLEVNQPWIGHVRYSTSDINYNQPIQCGSVTIAHNGVITQEDPSLWAQHFPELFKILPEPLTNRNDSVLVGWYLHFLLKDTSTSGFIQEFLQVFEQASIACTFIYQSKLHFFRNHKRPLAFSYNPDGVVVASTKDILKRAGLDNIHSTQAGRLYCVNTKLMSIDHYRIHRFREDLQDA